MSEEATNITTFDESGLGSGSATKQPEGTVRRWTRDAIVQDAAKVFREKGYHGTSIQDIVDATGLQRGGIYYYIKSKDNLLIDIMDQALAAFIEAQETIFNSDLEPGEKLRQLLEQHILMEIENLDGFSCCQTELRCLSPEERQRQAQQRGIYEGMLKQVIQDGIERGAFKHVNVKAAVLAIMGMFNWLVNWYSADGPLGADELSKIFATFALDMLATTTGEGRHS